MAFLKDMKGKLANTGDTMVNKTRNLARIAQLNGMLSDMDNDRNKQYAQLGRLFYEDRYGRMKIKTLEKKLMELGDDDPKKEIISKVLELKQGELIYAELTEEKKRLKGIIKCPSCGSDVTPDSKFCIHCGERMIREDVAAPGIKPDESAAEDDPVDPVDYTGEENV